MCVCVCVCVCVFVFVYLCEYLRTYSLLDYILFFRKKILWMRWVFVSLHKTQVATWMLQNFFRIKVIKNINYIKPCFKNEVIYYSKANQVIYYSKGKT